VVLTGIHLSSYGVDLPAYCVEGSQDEQTSHHNVAGSQGGNPSQTTPLLDLIQSIPEIEGIRRIRLSSLEPKIISEDFIRELSALPKVCPHFHLSLQSGCDDTLKRMNRRYTTDEYRQACAYIRAYYEHPAITTDVIVGFPRETAEEFEATRKFLQEIAFFEAHIFKYSLRQGTKAAEMDGQVAEGVKQERSATLIADMKKASENFLSWYQGKTVEVLTEERIWIDEKEYMLGHTPEYVRVAFPYKEGYFSNSFVKGEVIGSLNQNILEIALNF
jgi:threonylcarbamoyladenosine tRNA methylthiotransferase MtaB